MVDEEQEDELNEDLFADELFVAKSSWTQHSQSRKQESMQVNKIRTGREPKIHVIEIHFI